MKKLREKLEILNKKSYGAYKGLGGVFSYGDFSLLIRHVQGDPFASASRISIRIPFKVSRFPAEWLEKDSVPLGDYLTRLLSRAFSGIPETKHSGNGGRFFIPRPGQQILPRSSVTCENESINIRFRMGLPAFGRNIDGSAAAEMFFGQLPDIINECCFFQEHNREELTLHIMVYRRQKELQGLLKEKGLIGFVPNGARLPRASGSEDAPLEKGQAIIFRSPENMEVSFSLRDGTVLAGMGIKRGVNLIVGGGFHGKSTLLRALELGIYPHVPGDGREFVSILPQALKVRSENGRVVNNVNIRPFIDNLPQKSDTASFSTLNASGSTSQAASIMEAVNAGASVLLMDEDTCATNFMIRDEKMRSLVADEDEPITPFLHRVGEIYRDLGVSCILVMGGSGDYFSEATDVIAMKRFLPVNVSDQARNIAGSPAAPLPEVEKIPFSDARVLVSGSGSLGGGRVKVRHRGLVSISAGQIEVDIRYLEQLVCKEQAFTLAHLLSELLSSKTPISFDDIRSWVSSLEQGNFSILGDDGEFAAVRGIDLLNVINRAPGLLVEKTPQA